MIQYCKSYAKHFLESRNELISMWLNIATSLNIDLNSNRFFRIKKDINDTLNAEKKEELDEGKIGEEKSDEEKPSTPLPVPQDQPLPQALIEFAMIRSYNILSSAMIYAHFTGNISEFPPDIAREIH